ncbi:heavy-metal-associated domain-containing protein [uncultured Psychrobacter sp.]|uniref:heavy-metal-associated domain-containing protein n=1 Tax=uncultured Psychrobacter sp. TaxID=259303 RepID=UPI0025983068|nr:heavy-metal-associated domain-containing protein [uncultured Psychrobacter sp.]
MAIQTAQVSIENIDDAKGLDNVMTALKNITGVTAIDLDAASSIATVRYDDTDTSIHALTAAISMVDYVTQPYPIDAPQNPRYHD